MTDGRACLASGIHVPNACELQPLLVGRLLARTTSGRLSKCASARIRTQQQRKLLAWRRYEPAAASTGGQAVTHHRENLQFARGAEDRTAFLVSNQPHVTCDSGNRGRRGAHLPLRCTDIYRATF